MDAVNGAAHPSAPPRGENQSSSMLLELSEGQGNLIESLT